MARKDILKAAETGTPEERIYALQNDFLVFAMYYFKDYFTYPLADYHYDMDNDLHDLLDGKIRELLWVMFRESGKTSFAKLFIIYMICYEKKAYINVDSFDKENAGRILFDVVYELSNNKRLIADFGQLYTKLRQGIDDIKQTSVSNFMTQNGIRVEAHSTQESVRGRLHLNQRPDFLLIDDFENNKTKESSAYTKQIENHISEALAGMSPDGNILYLGNYITEFGNIQAIMDRGKTDSGLRVRNVPILLDGDKPAWGAKYAITDEEAKETGKVSIQDKIRQLGSHVFSYEMMNQPIDESVAEFKKEWYQHKEEREILGLRTNCFIAIDSAVVTTDNADYTGISILKVDTDNNWYLKTERHKINAKELLDMIFYLYDKYRPEVMGLEQTMATQTLGVLMQEEMRRRNKFFTVTMLKTGGIAKDARIRGLVPRFENKQVWLIGENKEFKDEARSFPRGRNDDVLDSAAHLLSIAYPPEKVTPQTVLETMGYGVDERSGYLS